jgi:hypothetical protein
MSDVFTLAVLSDIHYAGATERARGNDFESRRIPNPLLRLFVKAFRYFVWLRNPLDHNHLLDAFLQQVGPVDYVIANGDYTCDTEAVGVCDDAACQSAQECLDKLRKGFGPRFQATIGDHELGKVTLAGGAGGMRFVSYTRACGDLKLDPVWRIELGPYVLIGVTSSLIALPMLEPETLIGERALWNRAREEHLRQVSTVFSGLRPNQRVLLFCHDPTALPFLWREEEIRNRLPLVEQTIVGHLHSNLILWKSHILAGMPRIRCFGAAVRRMSSALNEARHWRPFNVRLCPALAGIQLLKDGGYLYIELPRSGDKPVVIQHRRLQPARSS